MDSPIREELALPEPARELLARTHGILDQHLTPHTPGGVGWMIGGGTILSARWKHRKSNDLDLLIHPHTEREHLGHGKNPELWEKMHRAGATRIDLEATPTIYFPEGRIELVEARPTPRRGHGIAVLESGQARVLSSAQILAGKLIHRGLHAPVRDLYDVGVALQADPHATAIAVNTVPDADLANARLRWHARRHTYRKEAERLIKDVPERYRAIQEDPTRHAEAAVEATRYRAITIRVTQRGIVVWTVSDRVEAQRVYETINEARRRFEKDGINAALAARGYNPGRVRNRASNALDARRTEAILQVGEHDSPGGTHARNEQTERTPPSTSYDR